MIRSAILPLLGYAGYPLAVVGGLLIFGASSLITLDMISSHMRDVVFASEASPDFNVPPVEQIGSLGPARVALPAGEAKTVASPESSFTDVPRPDQTQAVSVAAPALGTSFAAVAPPDAGSLRVGEQAVNVRAGPSNTAATLGVLNAGSTVHVGETVRGWVHVYFGGGEGWVYQSFLE